MRRSSKHCDSRYLYSREFEAAADTSRAATSACRIALVVVNCNNSGTPNGDISAFMFHYEESTADNLTPYASYMNRYDSGARTSAVTVTTDATVTVQRSPHSLMATTWVTWPNRGSRPMRPATATSPFNFLRR